jgi:hypothetical protein
LRLAAVLELVVSDAAVRDNEQQSQNHRNVRDETITDMGSPFFVCELLAVKDKAGRPLN